MKVAVDNGSGSEELLEMEMGFPQFTNAGCLSITIYVIANI